MGAWPTNRPSVSRSGFGYQTVGLPLALAAAWSAGIAVVSLATTWRNGDAVEGSTDERSSSSQPGVRRTSRAESGAQVPKYQTHQGPVHAQNECA